MQVPANLAKSAMKGPTPEDFTQESFEERFVFHLKHGQIIGYALIEYTRTKQVIKPYSKIEEQVCNALCLVNLFTGGSDDSHTTAELNWINCGSGGNGMLITELYSI